MRAAGAREVAREFSDWFGEVTEFDVVSTHIDDLEDRTHVSYPLHFLDEGVPTWCEQQAF